jgi:DNA-binding MarR family transcriptional regulator
MPYLERSLAYALHRARHSTIESILTSFAEYKVTTHEFVVLVTVAENPGIRQADLAEKLEVERPRIVPTLNLLEKRGLAKRTSIAEDGRVRQIKLTKSGEQLVRLLQRRAEEHEKKMIQQLGVSEAQRLLRTLWKLAGREAVAGRSASGR